MSDVNNIFIDEMEINSHDPRHHSEFLLLSCEVNSWKNHLNDRSWWLSLEKQCIHVFKSYGYELQSGTWFCLISAHRYGWAGVANATLLLAEGFGKKQRKCWPPIGANDLRLQIIEWYTINVVTCIYALPLSETEILSIQKLESGVASLLQQAFEMQSRCQITLRNLRDYLQASRQSLLAKTRAFVPRAKDAQSLLEQSPTLPLCGTSEELPPNLSLTECSRRWGAWVGGGLIGVILTFVVSGSVYWFSQPKTAVFLNRIWPDNPISIRWYSKVSNSIHGTSSSKSLQNLKEQLDSLELRLIESEKKRSVYMTISELKTSIYQMKESLNEYGKPVQMQISDLETKINENKAVYPAEIESVLKQIDDMNTRVTQLSLIANGKEANECSDIYQTECR